jgi:hypothetical protein
MSGSPAMARVTGRIGSGRYVIFFQGRECGEERWAIERGDEGLIASGEQETIAPHPFPSRLAWRARLSPEWRPVGLEIVWNVGPREVRAIHRAEAGTWRVRIEYAGQVKEQQGEFPDACEVDYGTHVFSAFILARRDFAVGGEHEFPALRIGPPYMAVSPERMLYRCVEARTLETPFGPRAAKRYQVVVPGAGEPGYEMWADERGVVLESYEGAENHWPWMKLVEYQWE